uniref:Ac45-VOA1_TM domain-containing protein n=1 Tax=Elaeophora elaphi TaxID=1147741 RepID=A0A0R3RYP4_9BILA
MYHHPETRHHIRSKQSPIVPTNDPHPVTSSYLYCRAPPSVPYASVAKWPFMCHPVKVLIFNGPGMVFGFLACLDSVVDRRQKGIFMWLLCATLFMAWFHYCIAYDTVILSTLNLKKMTVEELTVSSKVLAIGIKDFSLPNFGIFAQAYSAENSDAPFASNIFQVNSNNGNAHKSAIDVDYITFESFEGLRDLLASDKNFKSYQTVIISSQDAFEEELVRRKRLSSNVSFDDEPPSDGVPKTSSRQQLSAMDHHQGGIELSDCMSCFPNSSDVRSAAASDLDDSIDMPVVLPPPNPSQKTTCLLYMEAFDIIIPNSRFITVGSEGKNKYSSEPDHYKCNMSNSQGGASFIIDVEIEEDIGDAKKQFILKSGTVITFQLDFVQSRSGYWYLESTTLKNGFKIAAMGGEQDLTVSSGTATNRVDIGAVFNQNFACYQTDVAVFNVSGGNIPTRIGIALRNFEVSLGLKGDKARFGYYTSDCVGTFSAGSWMGIIISVVFISILLFAYLMVQSIHTMDRFDDLKQKQVVINFRE